MKGRKGGLEVCIGNVCEGRVTCGLQQTGGNGKVWEGRAYDIVGSGTAAMDRVVPDFIAAGMERLERSCFLEDYGINHAFWDGSINPYSGSSWKTACGLPAITLRGKNETCTSTRVVTCVRCTVASLTKKASNPF